MTTDYTVERVGTDSSGRGIYMTRFMGGVWAAILADPRVAPFAHKVTIVQGAFMARNGGGAPDSAGFHDMAGCLDVRTWNLTTTEIATLICVAREYAFGFWRRDHRHGMDPHAHGVLGSDVPLTYGAAAQWRAYLNGRDGLSSNGPDYEWRPSPLVLFPPPTEEIDDMYGDDDRARDVRIEEKLDRFTATEADRDRAEFQRDREDRRVLRTTLAAILDQLTEQAERTSDAATRQALRATRRRIVAELRALARYPEDEADTPTELADGDEA